MPKVDLDQDILDHVRSQVRDFGETPSSVLRRLLGLSAGATNTGLTGEENRPAQSPPRSTAISRYLGILSDLYREDPDRFGGIEEISGRSRIYFHKDSRVIDESGNSVMPERISGTPYFAATNLSDDKKKRILEDVLVKFGIPFQRRVDLIKKLDPHHSEPRGLDARSDADDRI
jgi:negative modulator of initiation of replication